LPIFWKKKKTERVIGGIIGSLTWRRYHLEKMERQRAHYGNVEDVSDYRLEGRTQIEKRTLGCLIIKKGLLEIRGRRQTTEKG